MWAKQDQHEGDRLRLFAAVAETVDAETVLYPGCYVDIAPSFVFPAVTYLDSDKRTPGFISEHCTRHLTMGGRLLVNPSHGDAAMASIDQRYVLSGVVKSGSGTYRVDTKDLDTYLIPKKPQAITVDSLHQSNRGVGCTRSPYAYLFTRVA